MAPYFQKVVGLDVSEAQILEAQKVPGIPNVSYSTGPAEELPFEDSSVDLVIGADAAHWFDMKKFMVEVERVLKPKGCLALLSIQIKMELHYGDCSEALTQIFREMYASLSPYKAKNVDVVENGYKEIIDAITFTEKERVTDVLLKSTMSVSEVIGYVSTFSMYQLFLKKDPTAARSMLQTAEQRLLKAMGVSSNETELEMWRYYLCVLARKPE
ncbi:phthiotriol/phenolphthiotriol dimycocerosates methyltransferase-like isoform X2 [Protopterus annectens]|uniref:phthiotriol/phenolphthiotriol dimycocerosates methyltransferase-like isoform X2 n=2 Tax=Protopterus annectens TaxID=7888 RepID=UPI001CF9A3C3|nr:phthiotriol/phenolphthiotriol dimycocerosates methyltransferase-like isoform X2 [Protopterus annectens]